MCGVLYEVNNVGAMCPNAILISVSNLDGTFNINTLDNASVLRH
jgi:hypothetical protein